MGEFDLIKTYFNQKPLAELPEHISLGIGDDCAVIQPRPAFDLVLSVDTAVAGVHFPVHAAPFDIATRSFCCALSDLAAMGAEPAFFTLAISLPQKDEHWLADFSRGLSECARQYNCRLIGGDTTKSSVLSITIAVHGYIPAGQALKRSGAQVGDDVWVSGTLGDAAAALTMVLKQKTVTEFFQQRFYFPRPEIQLGQFLIGRASACMDISDGLMQDAGHIAAASDVQLQLDAQLIPLAPECLRFYEHKVALQYALNGGDDYRLLFCAAPTQRDALLLQGCVCIGQVQAGQGVELLNAPVGFARQGYQHF
ncbi:MAG: thiamine-phosphate kinase [Oceanospirillaceae bacterium]|nr:thiamine-phosphate kinase [Oceanospirillaceae bacterium]MCP5350993.1 thiamine-phosphate kinase [Oceanospirillaceae bacterium]